MFIGNTDTNAYSTYDTILNSGGSTCNGGELNRTAYWVPAMFDGKGNIVAPTRIGFYYKTEGTAGIGKVPYYPEGLRMIADRHNNTQGNLDASTFRCNNMFNGAKSDPSATIPTCFSPPKNGAFVGALEMLIQFDYCWNGKTDTIDDWEANSGRNSCGWIRFCAVKHVVATEGRCIQVALCVVVPVRNHTQAFGVVRYFSYTSGALCFVIEAYSRWGNNISLTVKHSRYPISSTV
jgi:hypothetical protein